MKKAIGQTVRELKREVNKKVLKVPGIEQKILDATSNEPWGPHGSLLADIAMATRNYHEYQMILAVVWKRISDTGKNWRHVYKGLIVLEYLVANGSERVIDDIREHAYQISALSEFQYIDSSGRDQGNNVRRKSQSLVALVNDKEKIAEVRQKAAANRDKFRNTSGGGMYRPGGYGDRYDYDRYEGRYGSRDEDQNGYGNGREREYSYKDDERYRYGDSYNRDGDRYGRDDEDHYGRDNYRDDDHRGRSTDDHQDRTRSRSSDRDRAYDDNGSSRGGGVRTEDYSQDGRRSEQKSPEQNGGALPSYEEAVNDTRSPAYNERNGETLAATAPTASSPPASYSQSPQTTPFGNVSATVNQGTGAVDEFDPRSAASAAQDSAASGQTAVAPAAATTSTVTEVDFLGSLSDSFSSPLAIVPTASAGPTVQAFADSEAPSTASNQAFGNPFGDGPFKAAPSTGTVPVQEKASTDAASSSHAGVNGGFDQPFAGQSESISNFAFRDSFSAVSHSSSNVSNGQPPSTSSQVFPQELSAPHQEPDILADILPLSGSLDAVASQAPLPGPTAHFADPHSQPAQSSANAYGQPTQPGTDMFARPAQPTDNPYGQPPQAPIPYSQPQQPTANPYGQPAHVNSYGQQMQPLSNPYSQQPQPSGNPYGQPAQSTINPYVQQPQPSANPHGQSAQPNSDMFGNSNQQPGLLALPAPNIASQPSQGSVAPATSNVTHPQSSAGPSSANFLPQQAYQSPTFSQNAQPVTNASASQQQNDALGDLFSANNSATPQPAPKPSKDKFESKSAVWADTLSRGLVNLNISGPKTNPLADIGVDFDAINRKERRLEKPAATPVMSTVTMGKAMGSGSGMGRAGVSTLRSQPNPMMGSSGMGMVMGMGVRPGAGMGMGMGGYGGVNQQPMGIGMGMNMGMGMPRAVHTQPPMGMPPGSAMPSGYSPMMGSGGYAPQQPYGGGY